MRSSRIYSLLGGLAAAWFWAAPAAGQRQTQSAVNRPSDFSPSSRTGTVGGYNTRGDIETLNRSRQRFSYDQFGGSSLSMRTLSTARSNLNDPLPNVVSPAQLMPASRRLRPPRGPLGLIPSMTAPTAGDMADVSGFSGITTMSAPLGGWQGINRTPALQTPLSRAPVSNDAFRKFFELQPAPQDPALAAPPPASVSEAMTAANRENLQQMEARAFQLFKDATVTKTDDQQEKLARTQHWLEAISSLDRQAALPLVLKAHVALEKEQMVVAVAALLEAVKRKPEIFLEKPDLNAYFGNPQTLEKQMRRFVSAAQYNPNEPKAHVLTAYCAWVLWARGDSDLGRVRQSLETLEKTLQEQEKLGHVEAPERQAILAFHQAMDAALR